MLMKNSTIYRGDLYLKFQFSFEWEINVILKKEHILIN